MIKVTLPKKTRIFGLTDSVKLSPDFQTLCDNTIEEIINQFGNVYSEPHE